MSARTRLILVTPLPSEATAWPGALEAALAAALAVGGVDAVVIRLPALDERALVKFAKPLVATIQATGAAALLEDREAIVARAGADGVHLSAPERLHDALAALKRHELIVGVGGLRARHDAMEAAEQGADYVLFGEPWAEGGAPPLAAVHERAGWWAELFETPCVAYATRLADVGVLAQTRCEFVALGDAVFADPRGPAAAVGEALGAIADVGTPAR